MQTKHRILSFAAAAGLLLGATSVCSAQTSSPGAATSTGSSTAPYTEGSVWDVTMVRTKAGMTDDYLKALAKNYKSVMDEAKKQGTVLSYRMLLGDAANKDDFDILLMVEYKNMAALDGLRDKMDPIEMKSFGSEDQMRQAAGKRAEVREILGSKTMREITLK